MTKLINNNSDSVQVCDYCKKKGKQSSFNGRFCSKICIGKFAQIKSVMSRREKTKFLSSNETKTNHLHHKIHKKLFKSITNRTKTNLSQINSKAKGFYEFGENDTSPYSFHLTNTNESIKYHKKNQQQQLIKTPFKNSNLVYESNVNKFSSTYPIMKLKRGRPPLKKKENLVNVNINKTSNNTKLTKKKLRLLKEEIHESVYLAKTYDLSDLSKTICYKYDSKLLPDLIVNEPIDSWTIQKVANFIKSIPGCSSLASQFEFQEIDGPALMLMQQSDLIRIMKIKLGPALKIFNYILKLKNSIK